MHNVLETPSGSITVAGDGGTLPYSFSADSGRTFTNSPSLNTLSRGSYTIIIQDANSCQAEVNATINEPPELLGDIIKTDITCFGDSNGITEALVFGGTPPYAFDWSTGATQPVLMNLGPGNYVVAVTDGNDCQISLSTEIFEPPLFEFDTSFTEDVLCFDGSDGSATISAVGGTEPYIYQWSNGGADSSIIDIPAGDYIIVVTDSNNCSISDTLTINQPEEIIIEVIDQENSYCELPNGFIIVEATGGVPGYSYLWHTEPPQTGNMATDLLGDPLGGPYLVTVTDSNECQADLVVELGSEPLPIADFTTDFAPLDSFIIPKEKGVSFINLSQYATSYSWDFGDGGGSILENPVHIYEREGYYEVTLVAFDANLTCPDTARLGFTLLPPGAIYVPNAFTPNADGINDGFRPVGIGVIYVKMDIFDRWGKHLTTLNSMDEEWDGTNKNNNPVQEGVYVWVINATLNDGTDYHRAGTVTLIR